MCRYDERHEAPPAREAERGRHERDRSPHRTVQRESSHSTGHRTSDSQHAQRDWKSQPQREVRGRITLLEAEQPTVKAVSFR